MTVEGHDLEVEVGDFAGDENYDRVKPLYYNNVRVVLMCIDISMHDSLENFEAKVSTQNH
jgi:GTPase SAR1 family protein